MPLSAEDKIEIQELMGRYSLAADVDGPEAMRDIFTEDATFVIEAMRANVQGIDNIVAWLTEAYKAMPGKLYHISTNFVIEGHGDNATMTCTSQGLMPSNDGIKVFTLGHYQDVVVKTSAGWRLKDHKIIVLA